MQYERTDEYRSSDSLRQLLSTQPSHVLLVLSNSHAGNGPDSARDWESIVRAQHYQQHEIDITCGRHQPFPYRYLGLYYLSIDGAGQAGELIDHIHSRARERNDAPLPATWLFHPTGVKVGRSPVKVPAMLTIALANATVGQEAEFREWYPTRHIRHALNLPELVSGQCFERTLFQRPGSAECSYSMMAIYETEGTVESAIESINRLVPTGVFAFPTLDKTRGRFAECVYRPIV